ncbi:MAG: SLBB domain-containing protein, partial [Deltaproteobacteria bacterium]
TALSAADAPPMTDVGQATLQRLSPGQQGAVMQELGKTGGQITPGAVEALKVRPEFQNLSPAEVAKGKELLQQQEAAKKETAKPKEPEKPREPEKAKTPVVKAAEPAKKTTEDLKKGPDEIKKPPEETKQVIGDLPKGESLFERAQATGKYQDISLDLKPFGYDFFRDAAVKVVTDRKDIPIPMKYVVGPGDEVRIALWGRVNASYNLTIDRDGKIMIPGIGTLTVAGMTFEQMSQNLIKQAEQMTGTNVDISMGALRTMSIFILGDVRRPGSHTIGSSATITDALLLAGGPTEIGSMRNIQLRRKDKVIQTFDLYDLLLKGDKSKDVVLSAGDIVFVPVIGPYVGIAGNVKRPALYELRNEFSLESLFDLAGGIIPSAYTQQIQVERTIKNEKRIVIDIDDKNFARAKTMTVQDADIVKVFSIVDKDVNVVYLSGNVKKGGKYALTPGMRIKDILKSELDLLPETYFDYALIKRFPAQGKGAAALLPFSLADLLQRNDPATNLDLQPGDNIYVFSKWFFRDKPVFSVSGEVRRNGQFDLADNFKVKDAILTAGDLTKNAYLKKGEIIRVNQKKEYQTLYFNVTRAMADDPAENLLIWDEDQIIIHTLYEEKWKEWVTVAGEVKNPGDFIATEKMLVSDLIFKAGGQTRDTLLDEAELYRTDWKTKEITLQKIKLGKALAGDFAENVELKDLDRLIVHSIWEKEYKKGVILEGEVKKPGAYQFGEKMTVRDLIFAAGGETRDTLLDEAELYRTDWKT